MQQVLFVAPTHIPQEIISLSITVPHQNTVKSGEANEQRKINAIVSRSLQFGICHKKGIGGET